MYEMNISDRVNGVPPPRPAGPPDELLRLRTAENPPTTARDRVELSKAGERLAERVSVSESRIQRLERIRSEIANGTYESIHKLMVTAERLGADLGALDLSA